MSDVDPTPTPAHGTSFLKKKIGGIPAWAYGIFGLGLIGYLLYKKQTTGSAFNAPRASVTGGTGATTGASSAGIADPVGASTYVSPAASTPDTNAAWAKRTADAMTGTGTYGSAGDIANALSDYLAGNSLNAQETIIVNAALSGYGTPPGGLLAVNGATTPSATAKVLTAYVRDPGGNISATYADGTSSWISSTDWGTLSQEGAHYTQLSQTAYNTATKAAPANSALPSHTYVIKPGDTRVAMAARFYGTTDAINNIPNPLPAAGTTITLP